MIKFKDGDRVKILKWDGWSGTYHSNNGGNPIGKIGYYWGGQVFGDSAKYEKVTDIYYGCFEQDDLELVEESSLYCVGDELCKPCVPTTRPINMAPININKKTIMSKITTFVKNSLLSADEKVLRKYGLKNECGEFTQEATDLVVAKLVKENEEYLVKVAKDMEAEEKASK